MTDSNTHVVEPQATAAVPPSGGDDAEGKLAEATRRIAELEAERDAERTKGMLAQARKPAVALNSGTVDAVRCKLIRQFGNAKFHQISPDDRCKMQGVPNPASVKDIDLKKYFGPGTSAAASQLAKSDPERYRLWRIVAIERGIL